MKPTKILIIGSIFAALVFSGGQLFIWRLKSKLNNSIVECTATTHAVCDPDIIAKNDIGTEVTDPALLERLNGSLTTKERHDGEKIEAVMQTARIINGQIQDVDKLISIAAVIAIFLSAIPLAWYFLLRRIRELRDAILGQ
jgi:hypothetical protein